MSDRHQVGVKKAERAFEHQFFAVYRGETLGGAILRHRRAHGVGPLLLMRDFNMAGPVQRAAQSVAA